MPVVIGRSRESNLDWVLFLYLLHVLLPMLLLADAVVAMGEGISGRFVTTEALGSVLWLLFTVAMMPAVARFERARRVAGGYLVILASCLVAILLFEIGAGIAERQGPRTLFDPGRVFDQQYDPEVTPGVSGISRFTVNDMGLRGEDLGEPQSWDLRIIAIGGSTTECAELDDSESWPRRLMEMMNASGDRRVWIGNAGVSGHTTVHHVKLVEEIDVMMVADVWMFLTGVNDLQATLANRGDATTERLKRDADFYFNTWLDGAPRRRPVVSRLVTVALLRRAVARATSRVGAYNLRADLEFYRRMRERRRRHIEIEPPDLRIGIEEYQKRIAALAELCRNRGRRCIFLTQPTFWKGGLDAQERGILWFGWVGPMESPDGYLTPRAGEKAMGAYNQALLDVCDQERLECYDLASQLKPSFENYIDDFHFSERGAEAVAKLLYEALTDGGRQSTYP